MRPGTKGNAQILLLSVALAFVLSGCQSSPGPEQLRRFEFSKPQMGAPFRIVLYAPDRPSAEGAAQTAFRRVEELNQILSDYETDSELNQLSRTAGTDRVVPVSADLWNVLTEAQRFARMSDGAFDITVGPYVNLWRKARREQKFPDANRLAEARQAVGYTKLQLSNRTAKLLAPDMKLDLGGIAKGYAVDEAVKVLKRCGIRHALVAAAGDIAVSSPPPGKGGWQIEIDSPPKIHPPQCCYGGRVLSLANAAVSTSGDAFQHLELNGVRYSHIVDPRTGLALTNQPLVTVVAQDSTTADALATAISVLGPEKGRSLVKHFPNASLHTTKSTP